MRAFLRSAIVPVFFIALAGPIGAVPARAGNSDYFGEYFLPSGKRVSVFEQGIIAAMARLMFINWDNSRAGYLVAREPDHFVSPYSAAPSESLATTLNFERGNDGRVIALVIQEPGAAAMRAERRETFGEAPVSFKNGDAVLAGTLKTPLRPGPFPAVVLIHGSGPGERTQLEATARFFVHLGLAVLSYDKRGCGESTGDWKKVDLETLAADAVAGVTMLQTRPDIDARRVGVWGISQGGWIGPLAASQSTRIAFVINHSGPGTSLRRQDTYMTANVLKQQGVSDADIELGLHALNTVYDYGRKKATAKEVDTAIAALAGKPGLEDYASLTSAALNPDSLYALQTIGDPAWFYHLDPDRDAIQPYKKLKCPLLVIYGHLDYTVPVDESVEKITHALRASHHRDYQIKVLDRTGHGMMVMRSDAPQSPAVPMSVAPEYFALLETWLQTHGFCGTDAKAAGK
jgi:pimeloyl-ACP methyl ester carboxylesterase